MIFWLLDYFIEGEKNDSYKNGPKSISKNYWNKLDQGFGRIKKLDHQPLSIY